jgi:hypothetical protein
LSDIDAIRRLRRSCGPDAPHDGGTAEWKEIIMTNGERAAFIAAYSRLVAEVWADPAAERALAENPRALLAEYGLTVPEQVPIVVVRDATDASPDLETQVVAWRDAAELGTFTLYVPSTAAIGETELEEDELDQVVGGLDASCACCCPCCSTS